MNKFSIILTALFLAIFTIKASDSPTITVGDVKYELYENYAIVIEYLGSDANIIIPNSIKAEDKVYPVIGALNKAFISYNGYIFFPNNLAGAQVHGYYHRSYSLSIPNTCKEFDDWGTDWETVNNVFVRNVGQSRLEFWLEMSKPHYYIDKSFVSLEGMKLYNPSEITCCSTTPPICNDTTFRYYSYSTTKVYVPEQSVQSYKNDPYWGKFQQIIGIKITYPQSFRFEQTNYEVAEGYSKKLNLSCTPANVDPLAPELFFDWISSDPTIASVDRDGTVRGKKLGEVDITYRCGNKETKCRVKVIPKQFATSISLDKETITLYPSQCDSLIAQVLPENTTEKSVEWKSNNTYVATVDNNGKVMAKSPGETTITASTKDGSKLNATCSVIVGAYVNQIYLTSKTTYIGDSIQLSATVYPNNALNKSLSWHSNNPEIATVDQNGLVHGISLGYATITATANDGSGVSASCSVTVKAYVESITLDQTNFELYPNDVKQLTATVLPVFASDQYIRWSSSDTFIASVSSSGLVTGKHPGTAIITAKSNDGSNVTANCTVTVMTDYALIVDNLLHLRGDAQCYAMYPLELINNKSAISAMQFDMTLPTGLSMAMKNDYPDVWLDEARKTRTHTVEVNEIGTNKYRFIISSSTNRDLNGNSGDLVHMNLVFDTIHPSGNYYINLSNIVLTESNETEHRLNNVSSIVKLQYLLGDANADATVDVADYVATAAKILNKPTPVFYQDAANVNGDGNLNVTDLVGITNIALGVRDTEIRPAPTIGESYYSTPVVHATAIENNVVSFSLNNEMPIAGIQMDLILPEGMTIQDATLQGRANNHQLSISTLGDGHIRLLISAFNDYDIMPGESDILNIALGSASSAQTEIIGQSIIATTRNLTTYEINPVNLPLDVSCIGKMNSCNEVRIYTENGSIIIESPSAGTAQLVMVNGITRPLTVNSGQNVYQAERGYYIVRYNGQTAKVKL